MRDAMDYWLKIVGKAIFTGAELVGWGHLKRWGISIPIWLATVAFVFYMTRDSAQLTETVMLAVYGVAIAGAFFLLIIAWHVLFIPPQLAKELAVRIADLETAALRAKEVTITKPVISLGVAKSRIINLAMKVKAHSDRGVWDKKDVLEQWVEVRDELSKFLNDQWMAEFESQTAVPHIQHQKIAAQHQMSLESWLRNCEANLTEADIRTLSAANT